MKRDKETVSKENGTEVQGRTDNYLWENYIVYKDAMQGFRGMTKIFKKWCLLMNSSLFWRQVIIVYESRGVFMNNKILPLLLHVTMGPFPNSLLMAIFPHDNARPRISQVAQNFL
ncbi:UNVERIFIED_CONTAM: hypothetical protein NCL1_24388 [Trichonephila clavipes]